MARQNSGVDRRRFLAGAAAGVGGATLAGPVLSANPAYAETSSASGSTTAVFSQVARVTPADSQYEDLSVALNPRWTAKPDYVYVVDDPSEIAPIVADAFRAGARLTVRSGGHCFDDFVYNSEVKRIIDLTNMNRVYYDPLVNAIAVESGAIVLKVYEKLQQTWGTAIPGGNCYSVGMGGHVAGGGWGWLVRRNGLVVDHLYAVEVVTVDASGNVKTVLATREPTDPNQALWWAHTGGGGGNFGVVTRYLFRSPGATGTDPRTLLPKAPNVLFNLTVWDWGQVTEADFTRLLKNYGDWHMAHKSPTDAYRNVTSVMLPYHKSAGQIILMTAVDAATPNAQGLLNDYLSSVKAGAVAPVASQGGQLTWLQWCKLAGVTNKGLTDPTLRAEYKSAYWKATPSTTQLSALYKHLTDPSINNPLINLNISPYGGAVNAVAQSATSIPHRDAAFKMLWSVQWSDPADDNANVAWVRNSFSEVFSATGGVPVISDTTDGCYINYVDSDMRDPAYNKSTTPWSTLYYKDAYPLLQAVKKAYDPTNFFHHRMSVELPS